MEYKTNTHYSREELPNIAEWWQTHKQYDINEYEDYVEIVERQDHGTSSIIEEYKELLRQTDYKAIKFAEGELTEEEYAPTRQQRREWRAIINQLENN